MTEKEQQLYAAVFLYIRNELIIVHKYRLW